MHERFGMAFSRERVKLRTGGVFDFDAVSADETIIATIFTSSRRTANGNDTNCRMNKLPSDMLYLLMAPAELAPVRPHRAGHVRSA
jgi:hypothetical protein